LTIPEDLGARLDHSLDDSLDHDDDFDVDALVRRLMRWHFGADTGSPFWLAQAASLGFDPLTEVRGRADLDRFPDLSAELTRVPVARLLPAGLAGAVPRVFESGGTLGAPKRIVETGSRERALGWVDGVLRGHGVPDSGDWLHIGPSGPHIVGRSVGLLAAKRRAFCHYIDFDPRWVRRLIAAGDRALADRYVQHVLDQVQTVLESQRVAVVFGTPPVIEAALARPALEQLLVTAVRALIWSGTSISAETLRLLEQEVFPEAVVLGLYGNSLMGIAPQRPRADGDEHPCVFQPRYPYSLVSVVDPEQPEKPVGYGERGRVRVDLLTRDMFLPNVLERDTAVRVAPVDGYLWDGLAEVKPYQAAAATGKIIEGVY
jgi:hypothetical protein